MISTRTEEPTYVVNIWNPGTFEQTKWLVDFVNEAPYEMCVSSAHRLQMDAVTRGSFCLRPGFKNMFWFFSHEDASRFASDLKEWNPELSEWKG